MDAEMEGCVAEEPRPVPMRREAHVKGYIPMSRRAPPPRAGSL